jgi:4-aminobutyrate aminotransferase/(S)-3-amino-2-methylpropionate transaminase
MKIKTELPGPKSKGLIAKKEKYIPKAISSLAPFVVAKGEGALVQDMDGNWFIDFTGGWGCLIVGHNPRVKRAVCEQAEKFLHTDFSAMMYAPFIELAERLSKLAPGKSPKKTVFFNSGAEAVENAVKISRAYTKRKSVVVFEGAFHGRTLLTMTMTHKAKPYKEGFGPFAPEVYRLPYPNPYRCDIPFSQVEQALVNQVSPEEIACVVVEPIQGEGGFVIPSEGFLKFLREMTQNYNILLVADEIQTGMGRTGKMFACEHFDVEPDLIVVGKSIASGLPLSGVIGSEEVMDALSSGSIGGTYVGNPLACQAALEVLDIIQEEDLLSKAISIGSYIKDRFLKMKESYEIIGDVRGVGAMMAIELVKDRETKEPATQQTKAIIQKALKDGVILAGAGLYGNVIRLLLPLVITNEQLKNGLDILENAIASVAEQGVVK